MVIWKRILVTLIPVGIVAGGLSAVVVWSLQTDRFPLRTIEVRSELKHVTTEEIKGVVLPHLAEGFFGLDVGSIQKSLKQIPWIHSVDVRRVWPDRLVVFVKEQIPQARWGDGGMLSTEGVIFYPEKSPEINPVTAVGVEDSAATLSQTKVDINVEKLPKFIGEASQSNEMLQQYLGLLEILAPIGLNIQTLEKKPTGVWEMRLDNGIAIILGKTGLNERASRFVQVYRAHLQSQVPRIAYIDLRYINGFAIGWKEGSQLGKIKETRISNP